MTQIKLKNLNLLKVALYEPDIPQNTAAVMRLCACFGARLDIIEPCGFFLNDKKFKRVAMDYKNKCDLKLFNNFSDFKKEKKNGNTTDNELAMLTIHGVLHLLGYDHRSPEEETVMFGKTKVILSKVFN